MSADDHGQMHVDDDDQEDSSCASTSRYSFDRIQNEDGWREFFSFLPNFMYNEDVLKLIVQHSALYRTSIKVSYADMTKDVNGIYHHMRVGEAGQQTWKQYAGKHCIRSHKDGEICWWYIGRTSRNSTLKDLYMAADHEQAEEHKANIGPVMIADYVTYSSVLKKDVLYITTSETETMPPPSRDQWRALNGVTRGIPVVSQGNPSEEPPSEEPPLPVVSRGNPSEEPPLPLECVAGPAIWWAFGGFFVLWFLGFFATPLITRFCYAPCGYRDSEAIKWVVIFVTSIFEFKCMTYTLLPQLMVQKRDRMLMAFGLSCLRLPNCQACSWFWLLTTIAYSSLSKLDVINNAMFYGMTMSTFANTECKIGQQYKQIREEDGHWGLPLSFEFQVRVSWYAMMFQGLVALLSAVPVPKSVRPKTESDEAQEGESADTRFCPQATDTCFCRRRSRPSRTREAEAGAATNACFCRRAMDTCLCRRPSRSLHTLEARGGETTDQSVHDYIPEGAWLMPDYEITSPEYANALRGELYAKDPPTVYPTTNDFLFHIFFLGAWEFKKEFKTYCNGFSPVWLALWLWLLGLAGLIRNFSQVCWFSGRWLPTCWDESIWLGVWFFAGLMLLVACCCGFFRLDDDRAMLDSGHSGAFNALAQMARMNLATSHLNSTVKSILRQNINARGAGGRRTEEHFFLLNQASNAMVTGLRKIGLMDTIGHALFLSWKIEVARLAALTSHENPTLLHFSISLSLLIALFNFSRAIMSIKWGVELVKDFTAALNDLGNNVAAERRNLEGRLQTIRAATSWMAVSLFVYTVIIFSGVMRIICPAMPRTSTTTTGLPSTSTNITSTLELLAV
eukprot:TRINITY_DN5535_c0_g1_i2.p1 TRINITY_DN5535_c0_g1~~TRINITY_DN5535_c0_g1_i2.p1  ORF type:complete len:847 (+),score=94.94 TRINITY_DN5535_c0_g1_i2:116-2656(+)